MQPNIILVVADDMRWDFLQFANRMNSWADGRFYLQARTNVGLCGPYRMALVTGLTADHHGQFGNGPTEGHDHDNMIGKWVQDAGYRTMFCGKYMNGDGPLDRQPHPLGWDTWLQFCSLDSDSDEGTTAYNEIGFSVNDGTTVTTPTERQNEYIKNRAIEFINAGSGPFYLHLTPTAPHFPYSSDVGDDIFRWSEVRSPYDYSADSVAGKPSWITSQPSLNQDQIDNYDKSARQQAREVTMIDNMIHGILESLTAEQYANTVVMFTSDNGMSYGEFRLPNPGYVKNDLYEHSIHVPLVCRGPGFTKGNSNIPVYADVDVTKTIVEIAGATAGRALDGTDLRDIQNNPATYANRGTAHQRNRGVSANPCPGSGQAVVTTYNGKLWKLIRWSGIRGTDRYEMYNLTDDEHELVNYGNDGGYSATKTALEAKLETVIPPTSHIPTLVAGIADTTGFVSGTGAYLETPQITVPFGEHVIIDIYATVTALVADINIIDTGYGFGSFVAEGTPNEQLDGVVYRKLFRYIARGTGKQTTLRFSSSTDQALTSIGYCISRFPINNENFGTVGNGAGLSAAATSYGVTLPAFTQTDHTAYVALIRGNNDLPTAGGGGTIIFQQSHGSPNLSFTVMYATNNNTPTLTGTSTGSWSMLATEVGI